LSTYAIGDIQGCYDPFMRLLETVQFDPEKDKLMLTGDLINRGPQSLKTLRFITGLGPRALTVLGNHDLTLLAVGSGVIPFKPKHHTFDDILNAPDCTFLLDWLQQCPLMHHDEALGFTLVHAGLHPAWDLNLALSLAAEVESVLRGPEAKRLFEHLYGNIPDTWDPNLTGWDRLRFIVNCFTRMRYCNAAGQLDFSTVHPPEQQESSYPFLPWFRVPNRKNADLNIIFGHWAALEGKTETPKVFALDTGCVWGNCLTALRLEDCRHFTAQCQPTP